MLGRYNRAGRVSEAPGAQGSNPHSAYFAALCAACNRRGQVGHQRGGVHRHHLRLQPALPERPERVLRQEARQHAGARGAQGDGRAPGEGAQGPA